MATANEQARLAQQSAIAAKRDRNEIYSNSNTIAALYQRDTSNSFVLREEYLAASIAMLAPDFEQAGLKLPLPIRVSLSAPSAKRKLVDEAKPDSNANSKLWGNLVHVCKNVADEYEIFIANQIQDTQGVLAALCGALVLTVVGPTHHEDEAKRAKFPNGELTFKSAKYDEAASTIGITSKYRGNLVTGMTPSLSSLLTKVQAALGNCPISHVQVDVAMKSGLKQSATNFKATCQNQLCDALTMGDKKPFGIANISAYQAGIMEKVGAKLPCPICNPTAKADGSFLVLTDPRAEREAEKLAKAQKALDAAKKTAGNVIPLPSPQPATETPTDAQAPVEAPQAETQVEAHKPMPKVNRQGKNR